MSEVNLFVLASRRKFRFDTPRGQLVTEQLWDLPLQSVRDTVTLDGIAQDLSRKVKAIAEESFVTPRVAGPDDELAQKLEIVKAIIEVKLAERTAAEALREKAQKKEKLLELIAKKDDQTLEGLTKEQLLEQLASLS